jgi:hypothetical protein
VAGRPSKSHGRRRGRSRKRRPVSAPAPGRADTQATPAGERQATARDRSSPSGGRARPRGAQQRGREGLNSPSTGGRPRAPWHPLPLSELLILIGAIGTVVGLARLSRGAHDAPLLFAGLAAVMIGTIEVTLREHRSGYRSHIMILALLPTILFHSAAILIVAAFTPVPRALNVGLLILDVALFAVLFKLLRTGFTDAHRERAFTARR